MVDFRLSIFNNGHSSVELSINLLMFVIRPLSFFLQAKEYFQKAADNKVAGGYYNLGVLYLRGIGVERNVTLACHYLLLAANGGQPKALYQVAKMFQRDIGFKRNLIMVNFQFLISDFDGLPLLYFVVDFWSSYDLNGHCGRIYLCFIYYFLQ